MAHGHCGIAGIAVAAHQQGHGCAYYVAAANDHAVHTYSTDLVILQHQHDAIWRCGQKGGLPQHHLALRYRVKSIHILIRVYSIDHRIAGDMVGQW